MKLKPPVGGGKSSLLNQPILSKLQILQVIVLMGLFTPGHFMHFLWSDS